MGLKAKQRAFLAAFRKTASLTRAATAADVDRTSHYVWKKEPRYALAFEDATVEAGEFLEDTAVLRSTEGVLEPIFYKGKPVGVKRVYSDGLMQQLLRAWLPAKYRENADAKGGPAVPPLVIQTWSDAPEGPAKAADHPEADSA